MAAPGLEPGIASRWPTTGHICNSADSVNVAFYGKDSVERHIHGIRSTLHQLLVPARQSYDSNFLALPPLA
jgi:hypothetical protein